MKAKNFQKGETSREKEFFSFFTLGVNHLGNVLQVVTDRKLAIDSGDYNPEIGTYYTMILGGDGVVDYYVSDVVSQSDYYPFGMLLPGRNSSEDEYRYGFNGYESDDEVKGEKNSYTTFYRQYDPRICKWSTQDPLKQFVGSPYMAFNNNPVVNIDPNGGWVPLKVETSSTDANGTEQKTGSLVLVKEKGDDASTLATFLDVSTEEAQKIFNGIQNYTSNDKTYSYVTPTDNATKNINGAIDESLNPSGNDYVDDGWIPDGLEENYNCFESSLSLARGEEPTYYNTIEPSSFYVTVSEDYTNVSNNPNAWIYGKTLVRFGDDNGNSTHAATYIGTSSDGTQYFWTKNGRITEPKIMTLEQLEKMWGSNQGVGNDNNGGYYNYVGN